MQGPGLVLARVPGRGAPGRVWGETPMMRYLSNFTGEKRCAVRRIEATARGVWRPRKTPSLP